MTTPDRYAELGDLIAQWTARPGPAAERMVETLRAERRALEPAEETAACDAIRARMLADFAEWGLVAP